MAALKKYMVLQPPGNVIPDGSGDYHIDEFGYDKEGALHFFRAAKSVSQRFYSKKIRCLEYEELGLEDEDDSKIITVCDSCLMACCWKGEFMCDNAKFAGTIEKTIRELKILDLEHPRYWG